MQTKTPQGVFVFCAADRDLSRDSNFVATKFGLGTASPLPEDNMAPAFKPLKCFAFSSDAETISHSLGSGLLFLRGRPGLNRQPLA
jgi:hypothetical protein